MFLEKVLGDARSVIESLDIALRRDFFEIPETFVRLGKKHQMIARILGALVVMTLRRHIGLHAEDRLDPRLVCTLVKLDRTKKIAVIRHGDSLHPEFFYPRDKLLDAAKSVEQGIFAV